MLLHSAGRSRRDQLQGTGMLNAFCLDLVTCIMEGLAAKRVEPAGIDGDSPLLPGIALVELANSFLASLVL